MDLVTALQMYGYRSVEEVKIEITTRVYRRLVKENHPDNTESPRYLVGDITDARGLLNSVADGSYSSNSSFANAQRNSGFNKRSYNSQPFTRENDFRSGSNVRYGMPYPVKLEGLQELFQSGRVYYGDDSYFVLDRGVRRVVYVMLKAQVTQGGEKVEYTFPKKVSESNKYQLSLSLEKAMGSAVIEVYGRRFEVSSSVRSLKVEFNGVTIVLDIMF
jgi:hypothetical protein